MNKMPEELRTFETRLQFIIEIFSDLHDKSEILTSAIQHKLFKSMDVYREELSRAETNLQNVNAKTVINKLNK